MDATTEADPDPDPDPVPTAGRGLVTIDDTAAAAPYEQVRAQIATQVGDRTLAAGTRLPTVRRLAADLGIAVNTVARAYRELETAGLVETRGRAGTFVSAGGGRSREAAVASAREYAATVRRLGIDRSEALRIVEAALEG